VGDDLVDLDPPRRSDRRAFRAAETRAQPDKDRRVRNVTHRQIGYGDILHQRAVDRLQGEAPAIFKYAIRNREVAKTSVRLRPALDASGWAAEIFHFALSRAVEQRAFVVAADLAIRDRNVFGDTIVAEGEAALRTNAVVVRRIHRAV